MKTTHGYKLRPEALAWLSEVHAECGTIEATARRLGISRKTVQSALDNQPVYTRTHEAIELAILGAR